MKLRSLVEGPDTGLAVEKALEGQLGDARLAAGGGSNYFRGGSRIFKIGVGLQHYW